MEPSLGVGEVHCIWDRLGQRIANKPHKPVVAPQQIVPGPSIAHPEPQWRAVAQGITCKLLSTDTDSDRVSMLVRLSPGTSYPPHRHASVEELYLLEGNCG